MVDELANVERISAQLSFFEQILLSDLASFIERWSFAHFLIRLPLAVAKCAVETVIVSLALLLNVDSVVLFANVLEVRGNTARLTHQTH